MVLERVELMTRLTSYDYGNEEILVNEEERLLYSKGLIDKNEMYKIMRHLAEKLFEYEQSEEHGYLLVLPCKVGDVVYHEKSYASIHTGIQPYQITNIMISQNKNGMWTKKYRAMLLLNGRITDNQLNFSFDDIGKAVFLSKEEAENINK